MFTTILIILAVIFVIVILFHIYSGFLSSVKITERNIGPFTIVYREHRGDYNETGQVMDRIYSSLLKEEEIKTYKGIGIYYDDPESVETDKLRSDIGAILEEEDHHRIDQLRDKYNIREYPVTHAMVTEFPYRNNFSVVAGVMRVYPRLDKYRIKQGYPKMPVMEIYDLPNKKIFYIHEIR